MDGMCKIEKWLMFVLCLLVACSTFGQVVPVEMAVSFSRADAVAPAPANATVSDTGDVWIFVLDHSGSMADEDAIVHVQGRWSSGERKTSRWNALLDSFRTTLSHIEPGAIVQVVRVSDEKAELIRGPECHGHFWGQRAEYHLQDSRTMGKTGLAHATLARPVFGQPGGQAFHFHGKPECWHYRVFGWER